MRIRLVRIAQAILRKTLVVSCLCSMAIGLPIVSCSRNPSDSGTLARQFQQPPMEYRPYVWWHWMGPNFSKEGIRADLEAMAEAGIGGATIFNIASAVQETHHPIGNNPWPEQTYRSEAYWEALEYAAEVAQELGLKIGLHNSPGYSTTGGPWIDEEKGMQTVVHSVTAVRGGGEVRQMLPRPELPVYGGWGATGRRATFYRDIAVIAVPDKPGAAVEEVLDLSAQMDSTGLLAWNAPAGRWKVYRIGHAPTLSNPHPLPDNLIGKALEADKMSAEVSAYHWDQVLEPLEEHLGKYFGKSFTHLLIDSYEAGEQNWTPGFREYFKGVCGYDPLPCMALREADPQNPRNAAFEEDWRILIQRRFLQDGWQVARDKVHEKGLLLFWEPYWGPFSTTESVFVADVPMGEFWTGGSGRIMEAIVDKAKEYGKPIVGAEAFTGRPEVSHYTEDPAFLKHSADGAFVSGANRLFLHHWVHQPFDDRYQPGMGMGWWGTHFSRHQTWFKPGKAFFTYLSRCQMLLQQGTLGERSENWIQRKTDGADIYFVINPEDTPRAVTLPSGPQPTELWDPYHGTIRAAAPADSVRLTLDPGQSLFVVLPKEPTRYKKEKIQEGTLLETRDLGKVWDVSFAPKLDVPFTLNPFILKDFSECEEPYLKYFSGTATYSGTFFWAREDVRVWLNLGEMNDIAEVTVNGSPAGVLWYPPFRADITPFLKQGENHLEIAVTNNWANRLIGDEQFEPDFEWGEDRGPAMGRAMKAFPEWFLKGVPRPSKDRKGFVIWSYFRADSPLQPAGLVGPVELEIYSSAAGARNLVPEKPSSAPDYLCTWNLQCYRSNQDGPVKNRAEMVEENFFGDGPYQGWASLYPAIREDLFLVLDDSWDIPRDMNERGGNPYFGTVRLDTTRFPSFKGEPAQRLKALSDRFTGLGWKGLGGWICAEKAGTSPEVPDSVYWPQRLREAQEAGIRYWKVDWGKNQGSGEWRKQLTRWGREYAPELIIEHAMNPEFIAFSDTYRTYDVENITAQTVTIDRVAQYLRYSPEAPAQGIINCEDEPYIAAGLGCAIGIMRHPFVGALPSGRADIGFPTSGRNLKCRLDEVVRGVRWHRIALPFASDGVSFAVDPVILEDGWIYAFDESWIRHEVGDTVRVSAPARVSRNMPLPKVGSEDPARPFVLSSRYPGGAVAVATVGRSLGREYVLQEVPVEVEVPSTASPVGVFGRYGSLTLTYPAPLGGVRVLAQDLAGKEAVDITGRVTVEGNRLTIPGAVISEIGLMAATEGDVSDPGLVLKLFAR